MTNLDNWRNIPCILVVDLENPKEHHDLHNDYPLAPQRLMIKKVENPIPNLNDKEKYVIHHKNLKQYLDLGLRTKGVIGESVSKKKYIGLNTKLCTNARELIKKSFFHDYEQFCSLKNYGKRQESCVRENSNQPKENIKTCSKPNFKKLTIFDENLVESLMKRTKLVFDKPVYCGMCILDISMNRV